MQTQTNKIKTMTGIKKDPRLSNKEITGIVPKASASAAASASVIASASASASVAATKSASASASASVTQRETKEKTRQVEDKNNILSKDYLRKLLWSLNPDIDPHEFDEYMQQKKQFGVCDSQLNCANQNANNALSLLYQSFLKQNRSAIKELTFLEKHNPVIQDYNLINTYFDRIYVLNLDRRPDRWLKMKENLDKLGIHNYERFSAVDGSQAPHYHEWKHYSKMPLTRHELIRYKRKAIGSSGSWAILKASYRMLRDAKERGFRRILVLQDDLLFHKNFLAEFSRVPTYVKKDWKLLYLGATQHNWTRILKSKYYYYPAGTADGAFAVGIDSSIFDELMREIIKFNMPFDSGPLRTLQERYLYDSFVLDPNLIIADIRDSDLRHSRDLVTFGKRFHWDINLYDVTD
jgi:hypothetical protein